jgi:hypothetical protein
MTKRFIAALVVGVFWSTQGVAQELAPRAYWPAPTGTQVLTVGYSHKTGDIIPDRSLPLTGVDSSIDSVHLGYRRTFGLFDRTANITLELPANNGTTAATDDQGLGFERSYRGVGDMAAEFSINLLGAPALTRPAFRENLKQTRHLVGASIKVLAPTGQYESDKLINVGANRWAAKAEVGYISVLSSKWLLETSLGAWFFQDNDDFLGYTKKQDPVVTLQGHLIYRFGPGLWGSINLNYYEGGRSNINGQRLDDIQEDSKIGATLTFPFATRHAIKIGYTNGSLSDSDEAYDVFLISYSQLF